MKKILALSSVIIALVVGLTGTVAAAPPPDIPKKGPPDLDQIIFIHYGKDMAPGKPVKPDKPDKPGKPNSEDPIDHYELSKLILTDAADYYINPSVDGIFRTDFINPVIESFEIWDEYTNMELFNEPDITSASGIDYYDYLNVVSWSPLTDLNIIAVASMWYVPGKPPRQIVQFDVVFNTAHPWGIDSIKDDDNTISAFDIQNIGTHEAGHVVGLADLYEEKYNMLTMYGYSDTGETQKCSPESGDILGAQKLYGVAP
ncbi:matrixin family metalloprotease [Chloroflexota bacterium]